MKFVSTRDASIRTSFQDAVFRGLAPDGGLFFPERMPYLNTLIDQRSDNIHSLGFEILRGFVSDISDEKLQDIINKSLSFGIPLRGLEGHIYLLELFHGPTLAFKDVGARFMAHITEYFLAESDKHITIFVATSGDTGSAIANAFHNRKNINIYIFYPSGKITFLQEQQMTTLGGNVHAIEVKGTFDDCQKIVKTALMDVDLCRHLNLTTANSINVARLMPQIIYHAWALQQLKYFTDKYPVLSVPSGNFGNLVSAVYAKQLGFGIQHFIAATNANDIVPNYLATGTFSPKPSVKTYSNAMDVGNPSNFERLLSCYDTNVDEMRKDISGLSVTDTETLAEIKRVYDHTGHIIDPHTAVGVAAARRFGGDTPIIVSATAHPAKFPEVIKKAINIEPDMPDRLREAVSGMKQTTIINADYAELKKILMLK